MLYSKMDEDIIKLKTFRSLTLLKKIDGKHKF